MDSLLQVVPWPFLVLALYVLIISIITFLTFVTDKNYAEQGVWRTKEKTLLILTLFGGTPGALLAMNQFRHKTRKVSFISKFVVVVLIQVLLITVVSYLLWVVRWAAPAVLTN
jgi:uncharacterized membrane protein YsdA (DUF1294 family)